MEELKQTYYFNIESGEVLEQPVEQEGHFTLFATAEEIQHFRKFLEENYNADMKSFGEAHVPFRDADPVNAEYDNALKGVYAKIFELGDVEAKKHVLSMGILDEQRLNG